MRGKKITESQYLDREPTNPDFSIYHVYVQDGEVVIQVGGVEENYKPETIGKIIDDLEEAKELAEEGEKGPVEITETEQNN